MNISVQPDNDGGILVAASEVIFCLKMMGSSRRLSAVQGVLCREVVSCGQRSGKPRWVSPTKAGVNSDYFVEFDFWGGIVLSKDLALKWRHVNVKERNNNAKKCCCNQAIKQVGSQKDEQCWIISFEQLLVIHLMDSNQLPFSTPRWISCEGQPLSARLGHGVMEWWS